MKKFNAFTLAEILIVLVIIGVVAIMTLPSFVEDMSERIHSNRQANIAQKVTKAVELMAVNGDYDSFDNTEDFVNKLKKYLKIAKICDSNHLSECWPTSSVVISSGDKYTVSNAKKGTDLHTAATTNNVGIILADGAALILTYNSSITPPSTESGFTAIKKNLPIGRGKTKEFAYTSNATNAIDFVMDVNGAAGPNAETDDDENYHDIRSFKVASFSNAGCPGFKVNGVCVYNIGKDYKSLNCTDDKNSQYCKGSNYQFHYQAGARKACSNIGMQLPSREVLIQLFNTKNEKLPTGTFISDSADDGVNMMRIVSYNGTTVSQNWTWASNIGYGVICLGN